MTTVVANKNSMASDSLCSHGGLKSAATKIIKVNGDLIGVAGDLSDLYKFIKWYKNKKLKMVPINSDILVLTKKGDLYTYEDDIGICVQEEFYAIGTGSYAAMAAMYMGATPEEAVEVACKVDIFSGGEVKCLKKEE